MAGQQYDPYAQHDPIAQYNRNDKYSDEYMANAPYDPNVTYPNEYAANAQYGPNDPYSPEYVANDPAQNVNYDPYASGNAQYAGNEQYSSEHEQFPEYNPSETVSAAFGKVSGKSPQPSIAEHQSPSKGAPDYYVSLEPCKRGSSCSMYDTCDPKCMIRLVGKGYNKEIELSLDGKMDSVLYRIFRCLEDEGILLDGIQLQGLPKKNYLQCCLEALWAPFSALCTLAMARPPCCFQCIPQRFSCNPSNCPKLRRSSNPCRMARVCQGSKDDCVLVKISPSLPKAGDVKNRKRSTSIGTDEFPELEIELRGCKKHRGCVCPHCCSRSRMKVVNCRTRGSNHSRESNKGSHSFDNKNLDNMTEEELVRMLEKLEKEKPHKGKKVYDPAVLDKMTEEELVQELERLERGTRRGSKKSKRAVANFVYVERPDGNGFLGSGSRLVDPKRFPLNVFSVHQTQHGLSDEPKKCPETALVLKEVLRMVKEILKARESNESVEIAGEEPSSDMNQIHEIYRRSGIWSSQSDSLTTLNSLSSRSFKSSKSVNVVARLRSRSRSRRSFRKNRKAKFRPRTHDHKDGQYEEFGKLRIYVETDKNGEPAEFVPVKLTEKVGSMNLNTLIS